MNNYVSSSFDKNNIIKIGYRNQRIIFIIWVIVPVNNSCYMYYTVRMYLGKYTYIMWFHVYMVETAKS